MWSGHRFRAATTTTRTREIRTASVTKRRVRGPTTSAYGAGSVSFVGALEKADRDAVLPAIVGTMVWALGLLVLVVFRDRLIEQDCGWWLGVGVIGLITGLAFSLYVIRRRGRFG